MTWQLLACLFVLLFRGSLSQNTREKDCSMKFLNCYTNKGQDYVGTLDQTKDGKRCIPWSDQRLLVNRLLYRAGIVKWLEYFDGSADHSFCRSPLAARSARPFCFTDPDTTKAESWAYCDIPTCFELTQKASTAVLAILPKDARCPISQRNTTCYDKNQKAENYAGFENKTKSGDACLKWNDPRLLRDRLIYRSGIIIWLELMDGTADHNYCRAPPDSYFTKPFCFTGIGIPPRFGYCNVPECTALRGPVIVTPPSTTTSAPCPDQSLVDCRGAPCTGTDDNFCKQQPKADPDSKCCMNQCNQKTCTIDIP